MARRQYTFLLEKAKRMREGPGQRSVLIRTCYGAHYLEECPRKELVVRAAREGRGREKRVHPVTSASREKTNTSTEAVGK